MARHREHMPSAYRTLIRGSRQGAPLEGLVEQAHALEPYYRAQALLELSSRNDVAQRQAQSLVRDALSTAERVEQEWRHAELVGELAKGLADWRSARDRPPAMRALMVHLQTLHGEALVTVLKEVAPRLPAQLQHGLLELALANTGQEVASAKPVLRAWVSDLQPAAVMANLSQLPRQQAVRLLGYLHLQLRRKKRTVSPTPLEQALTLGPGAEGLRYLASVAEQDELNLLTDASRERPPDEAARLLGTLAGTVHRLGNRTLAQEWLVEGSKLAGEINDDTTRQKVLETLARGQERLSSKAAKATPAVVAELPTSAGKHALGLWNGYRGGLKGPHLRALARAGALCAGFGFELALVDFPEMDLPILARRVAQESHADGGSWFAALVAEKRVRQFSGVPGKWVGTLVATTPQPAKPEPPDSFEGRLCLLMGVGPQGLPGKLLKASKFHLELTGHSVELETATAMGVIAERLSRL
ncbi:MAG: DUF531 family protein [Candidatus Poseidoniia archaeon]|nr:DUF531 family protein [Candidatus Poseidoniia archaeon]MDP7081857.1 DUF531 family protein [Candidatus Poseidoniia archaeon]MDP7255468.1 DUF531 family protein [Candidatus Poseidoniia archaeon]MDP7473461.1 DUF531 family protein [Candidatus Poseidoniia archaeon]MDP7538103.1 DUF531 family protein [Candidatus Poseidoniia archaeon]